MITFQKNKLLKALVMILELLALALLIYLIASPFWPALKYKFNRPGEATKVDWQNPVAVREETRLIISNLPVAADNMPVNRIIIPKIGVNVPLIESTSEADGLNRGAWRLPESSTPDKAGNTVVTGHRFKYLPPSNLTFYLLDKLTAGDIISVVWQEKEYLYRVKETKIIAKNDLSILKPSGEAILTLFTCHPIYSQSQRLVVISELIK